MIKACSLYSRPSRCRDSDGSYTYQYDLKDQLGNTRVTFNKNPTTGQAQSLQTDDYYTFGMRHNMSAERNRYFYYKKELQEELGTYDYGWRQYDSVIARWGVVDPFAENTQV